MGIPHLLHIVDDLRRKLPIGEKLPAIRRFLKGTEIKLVHAHGLIFRLQLGALLHPLSVFPRKARDIPHHGGTLRPHLRPEAVRVRLHKHQTTLRLDLKFIAVPLFYIGNKYLENAGIPQPPHLVESAVPAVKVTHHADPHGIRRPDRKICALDFVYHRRMRAQFLINAIVDARVKLLRILSADLRRKIVGVAHLFQTAVWRLHHILVSGNRLSRQKQGEIPLLVCLLHPITLIPVQKLQAHTLRTRLESLHQHGGARHMRTENLVRIIRLRVYDLLYFRPVHQFICSLIHFYSPCLFETSYF